MAFCTSRSVAWSLFGAAARDLRVASGRMLRAAACCCASVHAAAALPLCRAGPRSARAHAVLISDAETTTSTSRSEVSAPCAHARRGTLPVRGIDCHWPLALHACSGVNACARRTRQGPMAPRVALVVRVKIKEIRCDKVQSPKNFRPAGASQRGVRFVDTSKSASGRVTPTGKTARRMFPVQKKRDIRYARCIRFYFFYFSISF